MTASACLPSCIWATRESKVPGWLSDCSKQDKVVLLFCSQWRRLLFVQWYLPISGGDDQKVVGQIWC